MKEFIKELYEDFEDWAMWQGIHHDDYPDVWGDYLDTVLEEHEDEEDKKEMIKKFKDLY